MNDNSQSNKTKSTANLRTMLDIHYLYPDVLYRFNSRMHLNWIDGDLGRDGESIIKNVLVIPIFFSKHSRTFHWLSTGITMWKWNEVEKDNEAVAMLGNLVSELKRWCNDEDYFLSDTRNLPIKERQNAWAAVLRDLPEGNVYDDARSFVEDILEDKVSIDSDKERLHRALLAIYSGFHHSVEKNIEGLFYFFLAKCGKCCDNRRLDRLVGKLFNPGEKVPQPPMKWFELENEQETAFFCENTPNVSNVHCSLNNYVPLDQPDKHTNTKPKKRKQLEGLDDVRQELAERVFLKYILLEPKGSQASSFRDRFGKSQNVLLLPIYDVWINDWGVGGIKAITALFFENSRSRQRWLDQKFPLFLRGFPELSAEITASAKTIITAAPIIPPFDLVRHFLKVLPFMQDWESAIVFDCNIPIYEFRRKKESDSHKWSWTYEVTSVSNKEKWPNRPVRFIQESGPKYFMWWSAGEDGTINCWSKELIPDILEDELAAFGRLSIRFEFPEACYIPPDETARKFLCEEYLRQQLDLMRILIPKIRSRRAALRSAVSAIMGRNMSHNIGSHVLARYSSAAGRVGEQRTYNSNGNAEESATEWGVEDHRAVFLRYLQRRMDFIAEVATAEKSFWVQPLGFYGVLSALNLKDETRRINKQENRVEKRLFQPILLSYITGKEGINASVDIDDSLANEDPYFACPGGEVGVHALYVILENIIRNSARHNADIHKDLVTLNLRVTKAEMPDLWSVSIIDRQSSPDKVDEINKNITIEPILNQDGSPNPKFWGIREMQVCAHYLRGLPMSELEGEPAVPPVLEALSHDLADGTKCLAYRIYLQRAKLCALISSETHNVPSDRKGFYKSKGIELFADFPEIGQLKGFGHLLIDSDIANVTEHGKLEFNRKEANPIPLWQLPVRSCVLGKDFIQELLDASSSILDPDDWLEPVHKRIWEGYRDKRESWRSKSIRGLVGWETSDEKIIAQGDCPDQLFCHALKADGKDENYAYNNFGYAIKKNNQLGCAWVDHGNGDAFEGRANPRFISAARPQRIEQPFIFAELLDSKSPHKPLLEKQRNKPNTGNELIAAALARVIVLDERVQNEMMREYRSGLHYNNLWPCMGIWVPEKDVVDLNQPTFDKIRAFLQEPAKQPSQMPPDFLVLHLTILENLKSQKDHKCEAETLIKLIKDTSAENGCEIVIVTGRGVPSLRRHNNDSTILKSRYLPISALLGYLLARPSKLAVMRALWSAAASDN